MGDQIQNDYKWPFFGRGHHLVGFRLERYPKRGLSLIIYEKYRKPPQKIPIIPKNSLRYIANQNSFYFFLNLEHIDQDTTANS